MASLKHVDAVAKLESNEIEELCQFPGLAQQMAVQFETIDDVVDFTWNTKPAALKVIFSQIWDLLSLSAEELAQLISFIDAEKCKIIFRIYKTKPLELSYLMTVLAKVEEETRDFIFEELKDELSKHINQKT